MERGLHVYTPKPLTRNIRDARMPRKAKETYGVVTHMGMQDAGGDGLLVPAEYQPEALFRHLDADQDGRIKPEEYHSAYAGHFDGFDHNHDALLTPGEIQTRK